MRGTTARYICHCPYSGGQLANCDTTQPITAEEAINEKIANVLTVAAEFPADNAEGNGAANEINGGAVANEAANGAAGLLGSDLAQPEVQAPVSYGKTRTIGRRASAISLAA